jgi:(1->4)-alpha-D-glucan 1-alpha-D-glucosylmutase
VEDTLFYNYNRLVALNEVGGDPGSFGASLEEFHSGNQRAVETAPVSLLATSTHDTKRSEDVRARISLLSEIPDQWEAAIKRWSAINERYRRDEMPDRNAEYLLYQVLVGAWPLSAERAAAYMEKASKEAKAHTSWIDPNPAYDDALRDFVCNAVADETFAVELESFVAPLVRPGRITSLAQTLIKLTSPGVPDIYQGNEVWDLSLVDPDNRRPVDFDARRALLERVRGAGSDDVMGLFDSGAPKLWLTHKALRLRREKPSTFDESASYEPVLAEGEHAGRVVAFVRGGNVLTVAPRLVMGLDKGWGTTSLPLPPGSWRDALSGDRFQHRAELGEVLKRFPVALLVVGE